MSCVAEHRASSSPARSGYAGALAARLVDRHPRFELAARHEPQRRRPAAWTSSTRTTASTRCSRSSTSTRHGDVDAAIVAYPHGAAAPVVAALRERGVRVVDLSADFRLRDRDDLRALVRRARRARAVRHAASTGCPSSTASRSPRADLVANPGCYPTATLLALAPLARAGTIADVVVDAKSGVSGAGRARDADARTSSRSTRTSSPYGVGAHRHMPEIDQELARARRAGDGDVHAAPAAARPGRARLLLRHDDASRGARTSVDEAYARRGPTRTPFVEIVARAARRARRARHERLRDLHVRADERTGKVFVFAAIDNLWKGAASQAVQNLNLMFGLAETLGIEP